MDRHEATTAFVEAGVEGGDAEKLGLAVELLTSVSSPARFLIEAGTAAVDNAGLAVMSTAVEEDEQPLLEVIENVDPDADADELQGADEEVDEEA